MPDTLCNALVTYKVDILMTSSNRVLFQAYSPTFGTELWMSNGTSAGTVLLKDIFPGKFGTSAPANFTQFGAKVLFSANDQAHGNELWVTSGTPASTYMLKDINPGTASGFVSTVLGGGGIVSSLRPAGNKMIFVADDGTTGEELWATDGTSAGTVLVKDINPGATGSQLSFFGSFGNKQLFRAFDGAHLTANDGAHGAELWVTDGTTAGTVLVADINPALFLSSSPGNITDLGNGKAVFGAQLGSAGRELWVTDGTAAGTSLLKDINPGFYRPSLPSLPVLVGTTGRAVFAAYTDATTTPNGGKNQGTELWATDGSAANTVRLKTFSNGYQGSSSSLGLSAGDPSAVLGNKVLFNGADAGVSAIWATDGTAAGTLQISPAGVTMIWSVANRGGFVPFGAKELFWAAGTGGTGPAPWITDGTVAGTIRLFAPQALGQGNSYGFAVAGNHAVFEATSGAFQGALHLWTTDGTVAGTFDLGGSGLTNPHNFASIGSQVLFSGTTAVNGTELWVTDGLFNTHLLKDINTTYSQSYTDSNPATLTAVTLACFAQGTRILTDAGETPVELLREGDMVVTAAGEHRAIAWIGHRHVDIASHPRPHQVSPVRIAPHAFADNVPHAPLLLSPDHAIYTHGVLIPVRHLVNGGSIAQITTPTVTYYHIELDSHDVLLAEGLPVESYLDTGGRDNFDNHDGVIRLFANFGASPNATALIEANALAPLLSTGLKVDAVRAQLAGRAPDHAARLRA